MSASDNEFEQYSNKLNDILSMGAATASRGGSRNLFWRGPNHVLQPKVEGEARNESAKRPRIEGEARVEGAKRLRIEGEARTEGEAREKTGGGVWGGGSVSPSPENFWKIKLEIIHFGAYVRQKRITCMVRDHVQLPILMKNQYLIFDVWTLFNLLKCKTW